MKKYTFAILFALFLCPNSKAFGDGKIAEQESVKAEVSENMESIRKKQPVKELAIKKLEPNVVLEILPQYIADTNENVSFYATGIVASIAENTKTDAKENKAAIFLLLNIDLYSNNPSLELYGLDTLSRLPRASFSPEAKNLIARKFLSRKTPLAIEREMVNLVGTANIAESKPTLRHLAKNTLSPISWYAHRALARMGDNDSTQYIIQAFNKLQSIELRRSKLEDLAFTRQRASVNILIQVLFSDDRFPSHYDIAGGYIAQDATSALAKIIKDFPQSGIHTATLDDVNEARRWVLKVGKDNLVIKE